MWPEVSLGQVCEKPQYGAIAKGLKQPGGPRFVRQTDIASGRIDWKSVPFCDLDAEEFQEYALFDGDLLISRLGNGVGNAATVRDARGAVFAGYLVRFQTIPSIADPTFVGYQLQSDAWRQHVASFRSGAAQPTLNAKQMGAFRFALPPLEEQRGIAATLEALDDKIESNHRTCALLRELGQALIVAVGSSDTAFLRDLTVSISRGVTPEYADEDSNSQIVINQKCVRDGRVTDVRARRMIKRSVAPEKRVSSGDILVNSTGTGTLGRVGLWHGGEVFADSHVAIVKADPTRIGPTLLAYLMFPRERDIESMATGSTGQTELSPARLGDLVLAIPGQDACRSIERVLHSFESRFAALESETSVLTHVRDTLLPELLSGRIRVPEVRDVPTESAG